MQFTDRAEVRTINGEKVGSVERVVLDPFTKEITHIVVGRGFLLPTEKVIPIEWIAASDKDQITLSDGYQNLDLAPDFTETEFVSIWEDSSRGGDTSNSAPPVYWYPPIGIGWWMGMGVPYVVHVEQKIPEGTVALKEGARVISADGKYVGDIERLYTDSTEHRVTHLLISRGFLVHELKLIPAFWIKSLEEHEVHLSVDAALFEGLPQHVG
jgi:sporulation protein YlmC with PRC-barrel domain